MALISSKLGVKEMALICRQLATAYKAGLPILSCLELVAGKGVSGKARLMLQRMERAIRQGATLADACNSEKKILPDLFIQLVSAGEKGGRLDTLFADLAAYYEEMRRLYQSVIGSLIYPGLQLASAWFLGTFALGMIKRVSAVFHGTGSNFDIGAYLQNYVHFQIAALFLVFIFLTGVIVLIRAGLLQGPWQVVKRHLWPINGMLRKFALSRFYRGMALLIRSGLDVQQCIRRSASMTLDKALEKDLLRALPVIAHGGTLAEAFSKSRCLDKAGRELIAIGEQSGNLDDSLQKAAEYSFQEAQSAVKATAKILQVVITLLVGCVIGYIVISFYGNLYSIPSDF
ncbi:MAG: type II secretion system F family protein [Candidatus Hydrogenedentales bacterium]|jgi:type IV pilus assembly protein PilC